MNCQISPQPSLAIYYGGPFISPTINIAVSGGTNPTCTGTSVTFTATAINTGTDPIYQWKKDGVTVGTGTTYIDSGTTGGNITCSITGASTGVITCATPVTVTSSGINLIINNPTAPTITCPSAITVAANHVGSTYIGNVGKATAADNCVTPTISGPVPAGPYSLGTTTVTWTVTDSAGQTATCTQNVTVIMPPSIMTFSPASGPIGSSVTITGSGFNPIAAQNIVFFGATQATVTAASETSLTVTVPLGATYQFLSVTNLAQNLTTYSAVPFNVTLAGSTSFLPKLDFTSGTNPHSVSSGDLDGDGKPDVVVINITTRILSVFRNTSTSGAVSFAPKVDINIVSDARSVSMGDLDGDGKLDLALANWSSNTVSVLRNTSSLGTVTFAPKIDFATGVNPPSVAIGDLNSDGKPELVVANYGSNSVSVFRNTSTLGVLSFASKTDFTTGVNPYSVSLGDIDGDGKPDLASANQGSNDASVLLNTSTSGLLNFATKVDFATGTTATSVSIGDINGDGKADLAVANYNSNNVSIYSNTSTIGTVSFATKVDLVTGTNPLAVIIGDVDGNGRPDLVVANFGGSTASIFRNTSTSSAVSFAAKVDITTGSAPISVRLCDIDGDGRPDLAVANYSSNNVSVIRQDLPCTIPTISCPGNQTANTTTNNCAATVNYTAVATGYPTPTYTYAFTGATTASGSGTGSGSSFNIGVTTVTITATNNCAQDAAICSFTVTVNAPVINVQGNSTNIIDGSPTPSTSNFTDFESVSTVSSSTRSFTIQNTGNSSLSITGISFTGTNASEFVVTTAPASSVAAGDSTTFVVKFTPTGSGIRNATIRIANNSCAINEYDFALQGTGFVQGAALSFDGVNDFVSAARPMTVTDNFTLEAWINPSVLSGVRVPVGYAGYIARFTQYNGCAIALNGNSLQFLIGGSYIATGYTFPAANQWYHVAFVRNSGTLRAYVNGVQTPSTSTQAVTTPTSFGIGCLNSPTGQFFNFSGRIDEVRLWDIVRTQAQIQAFMNCEIQVATPGLKANYQFNQGVASATNTAVTSLTDASGNNIDGTLTNFALSGATSNWIAPGGVGSGNSCTPVITEVSPGSACVNTTPVVITGAGFTGATAVSFGGTPALSFTVNTANQITAIPAGGTTGTISVTSPNGTGVSASTLTVNSIVTPTFTAVAPICSGANLSALPTTSTNGITGTWSPALNNTTTTVYTFTPTAGLCASTTTMTIVVNPNVTPTFTAVAPICSGASLSALPTTSNNGITGTWSPALNNTTTTVYTFTPTAGLCATTTTLQIEVIPNIPFYADADGDGYAFYDTITAGGPIYFCLGATIPSGYFAAANFLAYDCDDSNNAIFIGTYVWIDADGDGYALNDYSTESNPTSVCIGYSIPPGYLALESSLGLDCDDTSSSIYQFSDFFIDGDGDGYDGGEAGVCSGTTTPLGYATSSLGLDCDDSNNAIFIGTYVWIDADGDGYALNDYSTESNPTSVCIGSSIPPRNNYSARLRNKFTWFGL
ncbi:MAG: VCBS repeat-containing protein [Flavobacterium sp.]|nr:VCBS repeat-containing protein [Flavobacterium sp.]